MKDSQMTQKAIPIKAHIAIPNFIHLRSTNFTSPISTWRRGVKGTSWGRGNGESDSIIMLDQWNLERNNPGTIMPCLVVLDRNVKGIQKLKSELGVDSAIKLFKIVIPCQLFRWSLRSGQGSAKKKNRSKWLINNRKSDLKLEDYSIELIGVNVEDACLQNIPEQNYAERNDTHCLYLTQGHLIVYPEYNTGFFPQTNIKILRARVLCRETEAFIEHIWHPMRGITIDLRGLDRVEPKRRVVEGELALMGMTFLGLLKEPRGGSDGDYDLSLLQWHYRKMLPKWQEAKGIFKAASKSKEKTRREKWRDEISILYKELKEHSDLIERLAKNPALPDEISDKLIEKGGTNAPGDLALEHAARICGAPPYYYALSTLKGKLREQNRMLQR